MAKVGQRPRRQARTTGSRRTPTATAFLTCCSGFQIVGPRSRAMGIGGARHSLAQRVARHHGSTARATATAALPMKWEPSGPWRDTSGQRGSGSSSYHSAAPTFGNIGTLQRLPIGAWRTRHAAAQDASGHVPTRRFFTLDNLRHTTPCPPRGHLGCHASCSGTRD